MPARLHDRPRGPGADAGHAQEHLERRPGDVERKALGMGQRPRRLRIVLEREVAVGAERQLVEAEPVLAQQMLGLVKTGLAGGRRRGEVLEGCADHRLEGAEVGVVQQALALEPGDEAEHLAIALAGGADDELRGRAAARPRSALLARLAIEATGQLELGQQIAGEILLPGEPADVVVGGPLEIDGHAGGQSHRRLDLRRLGARQQLHVDVALKALAPPEQLEGGQHAVGGARRPARHAGREEEALGQVLALDLHERGRDLFGTDGGARDVATAERRAVAAGQRAGVGLHDAHEVDRAAAGDARLRDAHGGDGPPLQRHRAAITRHALLAIGERRLGEKLHPPSKIHGRYIPNKRRVV